MSARDPHSILFNKKGSNNANPHSQNPQQATGKIERLRAGKVPQWAQQDNTTTA